MMSRVPAVLADGIEGHEHVGEELGVVAKVRTARPGPRRRLEERSAVQHVPQQAVVDAEVVARAERVVEAVGVVAEVDDVAGRAEQDEQEGQRGDRGAAARARGSPASAARAGQKRFSQGRARRGGPRATAAACAPVRRPRPGSGRARSRPFHTSHAEEKRQEAHQVERRQPARGVVQASGHAGLRRIARTGRRRRPATAAATPPEDASAGGAAGGRPPACFRTK